MESTFITLTPAQTLLVEACRKCAETEYKGHLSVFDVKASARSMGRPHNDIPVSIPLLRELRDLGVLHELTAQETYDASSSAVLFRFVAPAFVPVNVTLSGLFG